MQVLSLEPSRNVRQGKDARRGKPPLGDGPNGRSHHGMDVFGVTATTTKTTTTKDDGDDTSSRVEKRKGVAKRRVEQDNDDDDDTMHVTYKYSKVKK